MKRLPALLVAAAALPLAGCGTSDDEDRARTVVQRFYDAVARDDGQGACDQLSATAASELESQSGQRCREVVTRLSLDSGAVVRAEVFVTNARVEVEGGESAFLNREPTGWKLSAVGCRPEQGKPTHRPFECELEV